MIMGWFEIRDVMHHTKHAATDCYYHFVKRNIELALTAMNDKMCFVQYVKSCHKV